MTTIAIIEDDITQVKLLEALCRKEGYKTEAFGTIAQFMVQFKPENYDFIILDWFLPDGTAEDVVRMIRKGLNSAIPIIVQSINEDTDAISQILLQGADDYIVKPLNPAVFLARVQVQLRKLQMTQASAPSDDQSIVEGEYCINLVSQTIEFRGEKIDLSRSEAQLAVYLFRHFGHLLTRDDIMREVWGEQSLQLNTRTLDSTAYKLRKKLHLAPENGYQLTSVRGHGYRLEKVDRD